MIFILINKNHRSITSKITKDVKTPTRKTNRNQKPVPDKIKPLFSDHPSEAKVTGTPTTRKKDRAIKAKRAS
jgi:hypothetical protein